ncbi:chitosanase [Micromonospora sp. NPDC049523]|uniref:chitosanase n=1 Tax=Micromonospora sp. NPDC049523 TaxID=3155921 RepID=UPI003421089A
MKSPRRTAGFAAATVTVAVTATLPLAWGNSASAAETVLSQGRPTTSSSVENSTLGPGNAVDGSTGTRWASAEGVDPQWLRVDLGGTRTITHVKLDWEAAYGSAYQIQTSADGTNWTTIYSTSSGNGGVDDLTGLTGSGRYVRMYGTSRGTAYGYSLWELTVYGAGSGGGTPTPTPSTPGGVDLTDPHKKDIAMQLVSSAENSSLDWRAQYRYIEDIRDGRGYTAGIIGFCSGTGDMLQVVQRYTNQSPNNVLARYLPALRSVNGSDSHAGLDPNFPADWRTAAQDPVFQAAQDAERDGTYFNPSVNQAKQDGLRALGQFAYYDAIVMHGPGNSAVSFGGIRAAAMRVARTPAQGGSEVDYLNAFLDARVAAMKTEEAHSDTSRVDTAQRVFLRNGNLDLNTPLTWQVYGDTFTINS